SQAQRNGIKPVFDPHLLSLLEFHYTRDGCGEAIPVGGLFFQFLASESRQAVELGAAIILARLPLGRDPTLLLQLVQSSVERPVADLQDVAGNLFQALPNCPAVERL